MTAADDFSATTPFEIRSAIEQRVPFVFCSPHSGRYYPERFLRMIRLDDTVIRRSEDCYVDELFAGSAALGAPLLVANFPRSYLDVNREPWELDPRMFLEELPPFANIRSARVAGGLGTIPRLVGDGLDIYPSRIRVSEAFDRIETIYKPFHECLRRLVTRTHARFGLAVLIDCHSMPASVRIGDNRIRPDFIVGDRFGTSAAAALTERAIGLLSAMGYTVAYNKPYAGGYITEHYGRPLRGLHALQIEINRGLYLNERTFERTAGFSGLAEDLQLFMADLLAIPEQDLSAPPLAAE
ncbi:MAG: N-formylglutamate amidohydrolase [Rhizobiaceae bacterium]